VGVKALVHSCLGLPVALDYTSDNPKLWKIGRGFTLKEWASKSITEYATYKRYFACSGHPGKPAHISPLKTSNFQIRAAEFDNLRIVLTKHENTCMDQQRVLGGQETHDMAIAYTFPCLDNWSSTLHSSHFLSTRMKLQPSQSLIFSGHQHSARLVTERVVSPFEKGCMRVGSINVDFKMFDIDLSPHQQDERELVLQCLSQTPMVTPSYCAGVPESQVKGMIQVKRNVRE